MTLPPSLASRVVRGAVAGRLVLTFDESKRLFSYLSGHPQASVVDRNGNAAPIVEIPLSILDPVDDPDLDFLTELDADVAWMKPHLVSFLEGLLDVDDLERLLP